MNRSLARILGGVLAAVGAFSIMVAFRGSRRKVEVPADVLTRPWVRNQLGGGVLVLETPSKLRPKKLDLAPQVRAAMQHMQIMAHEMPGLFVQAIYMSLKGGAPANLEGAIKGSLDESRATPGTLSLEVKRSDTTIGDRPAVLLDCTVNRKEGGPLTMHSLIAAHGSEAIQVVMIYPQGQARGAEAWTRLRKGLKLTWGKSQDRPKAEGSW